MGNIVFDKSIPPPSTRYNRVKAPSENVLSECPGLIAIDDDPANAM